jgi:hypothetical protein
VIEIVVDPSLGDSLYVGEVDHHAERTQGIGADLYLQTPIVAVQMFALAFVIEKAVAVAERDLFRNPISPQGSSPRLSEVTILQLTGFSGIRLEPGGKSMRVYPLFLLVSVVLALGACSADDLTQNDLPVQCLDKPDPGPCDRSEIRYYYDFRYDRCRAFHYGGCQGHVPFDTRSECEKTCLGK